MNKWKSVLLIVLLPLLLFAQWGGGEKYPDLKPHPESLKKFQDMKFGMFIHWGPSSIRGTSSWGRGNHPYDFAPRIPINQYDSLYVQFHPIFFDAKDWISTARKAGMKYFIMVTKHHDGFCNWDSRYTDYDIMSTPYKKDVLKDIWEECHRQGILFGTYYSICDWHHPEYPGRYGGDPRPVETSDMEKYMVYMKNQLDELIDMYHSQIMWFDGYWEGPWTHELGMDLYKYLRDKKDDLLINNRVDRMRTDEEGKTHPWKYAGDYKTPEQEIGAFDNEHPWESCITVADGWHWRPHGRLKSLKELIDILVQTVGGGGNLLLNIGPMPDGRMELFQQKRLLQIGKWLDKYGVSIYATKGGPFKPNEWTASTRKDNQIFLHILDWPSDTLVIPDFNHDLVDCHLIDGGQVTPVTMSSGEMRVTVPKTMRKKLNTILVLETAVQADQIEVLDAVTFKNIKTIQLAVGHSKKYAADGAKSLIDGQRGPKDNLYKHWLGFEGDNLEATIDLQKIGPVGTVQMHFLENQNNWIFLPTKLEIQISNNNEDFKKVAEKEIEIQQTNKTEIQDFEFKLEKIRARYVKILAINTGICPEWHKGAGGKAWMFVDEISVE